ncbi:MAG: translation elongation factor Ts [Candidatus Pacebacteria bacterium]|nr:translation elongation factor Ts [Candidatus Paceibacterota bacterium]
MAVTSEQVKELRDKTGVSVMECKKALTEADGDMAKALEILSARAAATVGKKADRTLGAGAVASYVHSTGQMGAMVLLASETDFVSKHEEFSALARDIAMHAAAMQPATVEELAGQQFIKDPSKTIADLISLATQKFGERIEVSKLAFFSVK